MVRKKCSRDQILRFTANLQVTLIGMEACGGAHFLARALREQGHDARLMPAKYVKPYVKTNKNNYIDAEAIAEAVGRARMRFVPIKTDDQLDLQSLHRVRERWVSGRTAVINQMRGLLLERGITIRRISLSDSSTCLCRYCISSRSSVSNTRKAPVGALELHDHVVKAHQRAFRSIAVCFVAPCVNTISRFLCRQDMNAVPRSAAGTVKRRLNSAM